MKKLISIGIALVSWLCSAAFSRAQDISPKGWSQWTTRNWVGFTAEILVFILVVIGIYKLALSGEEKEETRDEKLDAGRDKSTDPPGGSIK